MAQDTRILQHLARMTNPGGNKFAFLSQPHQSRSTATSRSARPRRPRLLELTTTCHAADYTGQLLRNFPRAVPPRSIAISVSAEWLQSPIGGTMASHGPPGSIDGHCSEKPTQPDSPSYSASSKLGCAWLPRLPKQTHAPNGDLRASQYFGIFRVCLTPVCQLHVLPCTGAVLTLSTVMSWALWAHDEAAVVSLIHRSHLLAF